MHKNLSVQTYTGKIVNLLNPDPQTFDIKDIAWSLAHQCRFNGHCTQFYSVAQHCIYCSMMCDKAYDALMHDAEEAYIGDLSTPVKEVLGESYQEMRNVIREALALHFYYEPKDLEVVRVDQCMLATEKQQIMVETDWDWNLPEKAYPDLQIIECGPEDAYGWFLHRYETLREA